MRINLGIFYYVSLNCDSTPRTASKSLTLGIGLKPTFTWFNQKSLLRSPIDLVFPFAKSVEMLKTARKAFQAFIVSGIEIELSWGF
jgi:hypothetical protein